MTKYYKKGVTQSWLNANGFRKSHIFDGAYYKSFPVYRWEQYTTLECEIVIYPDNGEVRVDVYDASPVRSKYAGWYSQEWGDYSPILDIINPKVDRELERLGIKKKK